MTRMEIDIAIEKARAKLLRLVLCWLIAASFFKSQKTKALPRRLGRWVNARIFKAELAMHYLQIALGVKNQNEATPVEPREPLTFGDIVLRLKAVKKALIELKSRCQRIFIGRHSVRRSYLAAAARSPTMLLSLVSLETNITNMHTFSRAPPSKSYHIIFVRLHCTINCAVRLMHDLRSSFTITFKSCPKLTSSCSKYRIT